MHLMLFTDQHSMGPKTTERVRVAEIEFYASSNDNCYRTQFDQSLVCLLDTRRWFTDNISTCAVFIYGLSCSAEKKSNQAKQNTCQTDTLHRRE